MAQLKDTVVTGNLRVTDTILTDELQVDTIKTHSSSGANTLTTGTDGQILKTNGTTSYWGSVTLDNVTDGTTRKLSDYAPKASPELTGTPIAPTATAGTNTTQIATTAFVTNAVTTAVGSVYRVKGTKATYAELPSSGNVAGDVWNVTAAYGNYPSGTNWVWTGSAWDALGGEIDLSGKQDVLTFDSTPTANSTNPVTSGGVYTALSSKANSSDIVQPNWIQSNSSAKDYIKNKEGVLMNDGDGFVYCVGGDGILYFIGDNDSLKYALGTGNAMGDEDKILATTDQLPPATSIPIVYNTSSSPSLFDLLQYVSYGRPVYFYEEPDQGERLYYRLTKINYAGPQEEVDGAVFSRCTGDSENEDFGIESVFYYGDGHWDEPVKMIIPQSPIEFVRFGASIYSDYASSNLSSLPQGTYSNICNIIATGKLPIIVFDSEDSSNPCVVYFYCVEDAHSDGYFFFNQWVGDHVQVGLMLHSDNTCSITNYQLVTGNEKVTSISSSSTNSGYPTPKAVYDFVGTLKTNNTTAQSTSASEKLTGTINLHKVSKTGNYNDLLNKPTIPTTLDNISDGSTRKLSNYVPIAGCTLDEDVPITFTDSYNEQRNKIYSNAIDIENDGDQFYISISGGGPDISITANGESTIYGTKSIALYDGTNFYRQLLQDKAGTLALTSDIPSAVTESTVSGWGFTKNAGTLTGVSFNGTAATVTNGVAAISASMPVENGSGGYSIKGKNIDIGNAIGEYSVSLGRNCFAYGSSSFAEGQYTFAIGSESHAEGFSARALVCTITGSSGAYTCSQPHYLSVNSVVMAGNKIATVAEVISSTSFSASLGTFSTATELYRLNGYAYGMRSHAEGQNTRAFGMYSHVEGLDNDAKNNYEHAQGKYNVSSKDYPTSTTSAGNTIFSIGVGVDSQNRANAIEVMQNGDVYMKGVGSYTGANYSSASTLQSVLNNASPNDSTITIQMNGSTVDTFTTNAASAKTINLGTVITSHQDISGKANVATTLSGYGITDASISGQTVTLGSNSVTVPQILSGTADPTSAQGNNGDIYIKLSS